MTASVLVPRRSVGVGGGVKGKDGKSQVKKVTDSQRTPFIPPSQDAKKKNLPTLARTVVAQNTLGDCSPRLD